MSKEQEAIIYFKNIKPNSTLISFYDSDKDYKNNVDTLEQSLEDLELYKTALKISCNNDALLRNGKVLEQMYLDQARKELSNEKKEIM